MRILGEMVDSHEHSDRLIAAKDAELSALREKIKNLAWVVKRLEYIHEDDIDAYLCPICRNESPAHYIDCELAAALKAS